MIKFNGNDIYGTHESPVFQAPALQTVRTYFPAVQGESEIRLGRKGRPIAIRIVLHNGYTKEQLVAQVRTLDQTVGDHGILQIVHGPWGGVPQTFRNCTFEGFTKDSENDAGPLPDIAGTLDGNKNSWWVRGTLVWHQLSVED